MKIAVTGPRGLIGSALTARLGALGHQVVRVVRQSEDPADVRWDPVAGRIEADRLAGVEAVVHLAGAGVGDHRWTEAYKAEILSSRVRGTTLLAETLAALSPTPSVLISASAVGYYGSRGDEVLSESSGPGTGFLAELCAQWEAATAAAAAAGVRVVHVRTGVVLSAAGGALRKQLLPFRLGLGARLGRGDQWFSWISRRDAIGALCVLLGHDTASGPYNLTAPEPVSNRVFTSALGHALHRPAVLAVPSFAIRLALGREMASEFLLVSQRVLPHRLSEAGYTFLDPVLAPGLRTALNDREMASV
jgi:hypothetical protein